MVSFELPNILDAVSEFTRLRYVASTKGGEWCGPCPFCGGHDRFRVWPNHPTDLGGGFWCRRCGKAGDVIAFLTAMGKLSAFEAFRVRRGADRRPGGQNRQPGEVPFNVKSVPTSTSTLPSPRWQAAARKVIETAQVHLWAVEGRRARAWLREKRGLTNSTIEAASLGFIPRPGRYHGFYLQRGVLIPWPFEGVIWRLTQRLTRGYRLVKGSSGGVPYGRFTKKKILAVVEGELDTLLLAQECTGLGVDVITLGGYTGRLAICYHHLLDGYRRVLVCPDYDKAGEKAALYWLDLVGGRGWWVLPPGGYKDVSEAWAAGVNLRAWIVKNLT